MLIGTITAATKAPLLPTRSAPGVDDRADNFLGVNPVQVDARNCEVRVAQLALMTLSGTPSRAISTACAWRS
jgi:hypothetical protein